MGNQSYWLVAIDYVTGEIKEKTVAFSQRFTEDKVNYEDTDIVILSDGVILNKFELLGKYDCKDLAEYMQTKCLSASFPSEMIGPFNSFIYDKNKKTGMAFGNQTGDSSVFYRIDEQESLLVLSNNFNCIIEKNDAHRFLDEQSAHYLLTYGFLVSDGTIIKGVKRLPPGKKLVFSEDGVKVATYHRFDFLNRNDISLDEAIDKIDELFRKAVRRCFEKDIEYGYTTHLADLSAGLDSRMVNWVARDMGYNDFVNITYSQSGSDENKLLEGLTRVLKSPVYYRQLDDASFIFEAEDTIREEFGLAYYFGFTGGRQFLQLIDFDKFGLQHTGQIGDIVLSMSKISRNNTEIDFSVGRCSKLLKLRYQSQESYASNEEFLFYTRGFRGALSTHYIRSNYTYAVSPFLDPELIAYCLSIPDSIRRNHYLYWAWIDKKYPLAGKIKSSRERFYAGAPISAKLYHYRKKAARGFNKYANKVLRKAGLGRFALSGANMNPWDYWYDTNPDIREFVRNYTNEHLHILSSYSHLRDEVIAMSRSGRASDKLLAVSLLATIKVYDLH